MMEALIELTRKRQDESEQIVFGIDHDEIILTQSSERIKEPKSSMATNLAKRMQ